MQVHAIAGYERSDALNLVDYYKQFFLIVPLKSCVYKAAEWCDRILNSDNYIMKREFVNWINVIF